MSAQNLVPQTLYFAVATTIVIGLSLLIPSATGKPSMQPIELDSHGQVYGGQSDQKHYIDRTELLSFPVDMNPLDLDDDVDRETLTFGRAAGGRSTLEQRPSRESSFNETGEDLRVTFQRTSNKEETRGPVYTVIKLAGQ